MPGKTIKVSEVQGTDQSATQDVAQLPSYVLPAPVYQTLKWVVLVLLPLVAVAYPQLAAIWGWPLSDQVAQTCNVAALALGVLIGVSQLKPVMTGGK